MSPRKKDRTAADARAQRAEDKHPARSEQTQGGFAQGYKQKPDTAEESREPNFARGISGEAAHGTERHGRFSEGHEQTGKTAEKKIERRFSQGVERSPTSE